MVSKKCSGQCTRLSTLRPEFDSCDRQWLYVTGYGGRPLGHVGSLRAGAPATSHTNDPLALTSVPKRDINIGCRICLLIVVKFSSKFSSVQFSELRKKERSVSYLIEFKHSK